MPRQSPWLPLAALSLVALTFGALTPRAFAAGNYGKNRDNSRVALTIPQGTVIPVTLDQTLSSRTNRTGDAFTVTVQSSQEGDNEFPRGTKIAGVISEVQRKAAGQTGMLDVTFQRVLLPNGQQPRMQGSVVSLDEKNVVQGSDGRIMARNTKSRDRLKFIAIGGGAGLVVGTLTKHTLLGGILGATAGYFYSQQAGGRPADVTVAAGMSFGVILDGDMTYTANRTFTGAHDTYRKGPHRSYYPTRQQEITVMMNGHAVSLGATPAFEDQGNIFIPLTPVMQATRTSFTYDDHQQTVLVNTDQGELHMKIGKSYALLQGEKEALEAPAVVQNGEVFVTPNYLALATNMHVLWDSDTRTVSLSYSEMPGKHPRAQEEITVTLKGETVPLGANQAFLVANEVLVPLAPVMEAAKLPYAYNEKWQSVRVETDGGTLYLNMDTPYALLDGTQMTLETPAQVVNGQVYVPLRFLALATGLRASWNTRQQTVTLN